MLEGKFFDVITEGDEIDEVIYDEAINGFVELSNKTDITITISIVTNVPVVQFKEKRIKLKQNERKKIEYTILSNLVETDLDGEAILTAVLDSQRDEIRLPIHLICGK